MPTISPVIFADQLGEEYSAVVNDTHKKDLGQYFTPAAVAKFMATFENCTGASIRLLDPGCGIGILSCAIAEHLIIVNPGLTELELIAFETDPEILPYTERVFEYLTSWLKEKKIRFTYFLCKNDFILHNSYLLSGGEASTELYDIIVANPPYFKLKKNDPRLVVAKPIIYGQPNIYSMFMILSARLLSPDGSLIFITPRSFCSGSYFRIFRDKFFSLVQIKAIHLFDSRKDAFKRDQIIQENIIIYAGNKQHTLGVNDPPANVQISTSKNLDDLTTRFFKTFPIDQLIVEESYQKILHLPINEIDEQVMAVFKSWDGSLNKYGLEISTGKVVDFRSENFIRATKSRITVPLIWLNNVEKMNLRWPIFKGLKGKKKNQFIIRTEESLSRLVRNKNYVLLRRFSSKDDAKRLIAAPYFKKSFQTISYVGFENHLNYIYKIKGQLSTNEVYGLAGLLNSKLFDLYFRTFNGNINVSATELRDFPLPDMNLIKSLGRIIVKRNAFSDYDLDAAIKEIFQLNLFLNE